MNDIAFLPLPKGRATLVDAWLMPHLMEFKWRQAPNGYIRAHGAMKQGKRKHIALHRIINSTPQGLSTDHRNGFRFDNRASNLRSCTTMQNGGNRKKQANTISKYKGVCFIKENCKWRAYIGFCGTDKTSLGTFETENEAALAYNNAALARYGEFARLNIIEKGTQ